MIRNWNEVQRIIGQRDTLKSENEAMRRELDQLKAQQQAGPPESPNPNGKPTSPDDAPVSRAEFEQLKTKQRRSEITDVVLKRVPEAHKDAVRAMVRMLEDEPGAIDMKTDDTQAQGLKALEKLSARHPGYFQPADGTPQPGHTSAPTRSLAGLTWDQLSEDEQRSMSDDDFAKFFGPNANGGRKTILGGGYGRT